MKYKEALDYCIEQEKPTTEKDILFTVHNYIQIQGSLLRLIVHVNRIVTSGKGKLLRLLFNTITRIVLILPRTKLITQLFLATIYT